MARWQRRMKYNVTLFKMAFKMNLAAHYEQGCHNELAPGERRPRRFSPLRRPWVEELKQRNSIGNWLSQINSFLFYELLNFLFRILLNDILFHKRFMCQPQRERIAFQTGSTSGVKIEHHTMQTCLKLRCIEGWREIQILNWKLASFYIFSYTS